MCSFHIETAGIITSQMSNTALTAALPPEPSQTNGDVSPAMDPKVLHSRTFQNMKIGDPLQGESDTHRHSWNNTQLDPP